MAHHGADGVLDRAVPVESTTARVTVTRGKPPRTSGGPASAPDREDLAGPDWAHRATRRAAAMNSAESVSGPGSRPVDGTPAAIASGQVLRNTSSLSLALTCGVLVCGSASGTAERHRRMQQWRRDHRAPAVSPKPPQARRLRRVRTTVDHPCRPLRRTAPGLRAHVPATGHRRVVAENELSTSIGSR